MWLTAAKRGAAQQKHEREPPVRHRKRGGTRMESAIDSPTVAWRKLWDLVVYSYLLLGLTYLRRGLRLQHHKAAQADRPPRFRTARLLEDTRRAFPNKRNTHVHKTSTQTNVLVRLGRLISITSWVPHTSFVTALSQCRNAPIDNARRILRRDHAHVLQLLCVQHGVALLVERAAPQDTPFAHA